MNRSRCTAPLKHVGAPAPKVKTLTASVKQQHHEARALKAEKNRALP